MNRRGLSLIEAVIVIFVIGLLAYLAVPRFSRAAPESDRLNPRPVLVTLRSAIELYFYDHGCYPGQRSDGCHPAGSAEAFCAQLTGYTDAEGQVSAAGSETCRFGPYLRDGIPACPVPPRRGLAGVVITTEAPAYQESAADAGWVYNCQTGAISLNSDAIDESGSAYDRH